MTAGANSFGAYAFGEAADAAPATATTTASCQEKNKAKCRDSRNHDFSFKNEWFTWTHIRHHEP